DDPQDHPRLARGGILREGPLSIRLTAPTHSLLTARPGTPYTQHTAGLTTARCADSTVRSSGAGPGTAPFRRAAAPCSAWRPRPGSSRCRPIPPTPEWY